MQTKLTPWPETMQPAIGTVNSFGITGTNAHIVLAEAPQNHPITSDKKTAREYILPLSAQTPEALRSLADSYRVMLTGETPPGLNDLCYTAACRRTHHTKRLALVAASRQELTEQLSGFLNQASPANAKSERIAEQAKVVFVFPGQGAQWLGMGRELLEQNEAFREALMQCEQALQPWVDWSLLEQVRAGNDSPAYRLNEISVIQPVLFAFEVALAAIWRAWGIEPSAVIGHSMGEVAAAYISGALSLNDAARIICKRSQLMQRISGQGAMAVIGLPFSEVEKILKGYEDKLSIAVQNSPKSTVLSGDPAALETLMQKLRDQEIFCRLIKVDVASHSPQMDPLRPELVQSLAGIQTQATTIPFYSTVTQNICAGQSLDAEYWGMNLRQPVRFSATIEQLLEDDHVVFIELSPHPILLSSIEETANEANKPAFGFASIRRDQPETCTILGELGSLYMLGYNLDWNKLYPNGGEVVSLPAYPWQRERYWFETSSISLSNPVPVHIHCWDNICNPATGEHIWETSHQHTVVPLLKRSQGTWFGSLSCRGICRSGTGRGG